MASSPSAPHHPFWRDSSRAQLIALTLALLLPVLFVLYTGEVWEDFFITYRHSENLVQGRGLLYTVGERVHGFTSVLNTLLPALFAWITQARDFTTPLLLYRMVSLACLGAGLWGILRATTPAAEATRLQRVLAMLFPLLAVLEIKITAFTMNGQEAGLMLGFLAILLVFCYEQWPRERVVPGGFCVAGLLYTRPDAFVYIGIVALSGLALTTGSRRAMAAALVRSVVLGLILFLPWLIFAHLYYGSIIPHTIIAKRNTVSLMTFSPDLISRLANGVVERLSGGLSAIYDYQRDVPGAWPAWVHFLAITFEGAAVTYWLVPQGDRIGRLASLSAALILAYLTYVGLIAPCAPWYYPPFAMVSLLALSRIMVTLPTHWPGKFSQIGALALAGSLFFLLGFVFWHSLHGLRIKQEVIDWGHRRPLGLWLKEHVADQETVYLEPLGYIGYFSQRRMQDWPGLVSPAVVAARQKIGRISYPWGDYLWAKVAEEIQPDWIVARPVELDQMKVSQFLRQHYRLTRVFNVADKIIAEGEFPGCFITYNDSVFLIFRKDASGNNDSTTWPMRPPP